LPHFQRAVAEFASYYEAYFEIGAADLKLGRITEAETAFRRSIELSGSRYEYPMFALGAILDNQGRYADAEEVIRRGLDLNPDAWNGHYFLGMALFGLNRLDEAEESVREALRQKPDTVESLRLIVNIHIRKRNYSALLEDLDEYLKLDPDSSFGEIAREDRDAVQSLLAHAPAHPEVAVDVDAKAVGRAGSGVDELALVGDARAAVHLDVARVSVRLDGVFELLKPTSVPLHVAIQEYLSLRKPPERPQKLVPDIVAQLLEDKKIHGASVRHVQTLRRQLNRFAAGFRTNIGSTTARLIEQWLASLKVGPTWAVGRFRLRC
jgi:tetratricopeptide (TPR) repeat protein